MTKELHKSSKRKQKLHYKSKTNENEKKCKVYKSLFEILKKFLKNCITREENVGHDKRSYW